jgi:hypothetical protein
MIGSDVGEVGLQVEGRAVEFDYALDQAGA